MTSTTLNMSMMKNSPQLLSYDIAPGVRAFSTMRHGGVGEGAYSSFNINSYCGDSQENIAANKASLAETLGIEPTKILLPHQVHGADFCIKSGGGRIAEKVSALFLGEQYCDRSSSRE